LIITESHYFFEKMNLKRFNSSAVIFLKKITAITLPKEPEISDNLSIAYIGNIGNIYDFESLLFILQEVKKVRPISLELIGAGDLKDWLLKELDRLEITYNFYGATFDEKIKQKVIGSSWLGYNGFKSSTEVALSYKSIDYLSFDTPLLNSAKGDTYDLINQYKVGLNFSSNDLNTLVTKLNCLTRESIIQYKHRVREVFVENFSEESYFNEMDDLVGSL